jgi:hypothetical protein
MYIPPSTFSQRSSEYTQALVTETGLTPRAIGMGYVRELVISQHIV